MISVIDIKKVFKGKKEVVALDEVNLAFPNKGMVFIIGRSGSGKSTFLNLLAGFDKPSSGSIKVDGVDITKLSESKLSEYLFNKVGFVFQNYSLIEQLDVKSNLSLGSKKPYRKLKLEVANVLEEVGLKNYEDRKVNKLSGGEKQRVALARAILKKPSIILADEPCGNLDGRSSKLVLDILKEYSKDHLVIVVSHNLKDAYFYGDRVIELDKGKVKLDRTYDPTYQGKEGYQRIDDGNSINLEEIDKINEEFIKGEIKGISRKRDYFLPGKINLNEEESPIQESKKASFLPLISKLLNRGVGKTISFIILIALSLSLFSICYSVNSFDDEAFFNQTYDVANSTSISYLKGRESSDEVSYEFMARFSKEDVDKVIDNGYEGNYYPLHRLKLDILDANNRFMNQERVINQTNFSDFFSMEIGGVLLCDTSFIKKNLGITSEELDITYASEIKDSGILITDYVAASFIYYGKGSYLTPEDVLGTHYDIYDHPYLYVNGIINTGYEDRFAYLKEASGDSYDFDYETLLEEGKLSDYEYIKNCLNIAYSTNEDFLETYIEEYKPMVYKYVWEVSSSNEISPISTSGYLTYSTALPENSLMIRRNYLFPYYDTTDPAELESLVQVDDGYSLWAYGNASNKDLFENDPRYEFDNFYVADNHTDSYWKSDVVGHIHSIPFYADYASYKEIALDNFYAYEYYFDDIEQALTYRKDFNQNNIMVNSVSTEVISSVSDATYIFQDAFYILSIVTAVLAGILMIYYAYIIVKKNTYNIGVLKSLGYKGNELSGYYLLSLLGFFLVTSILIFGLSIFGINLVDSLLRGSISNSLDGLEILLGDYRILGFSFPLYSYVILAILGIVLFVCLVYVYILSRMKSIEVLSNKE